MAATVFPHIWLVGRVDRPCVPLDPEAAIGLNNLLCPRMILSFFLLRGPFEMADPKLPSRRKRKAHHSVSFRAPWIEGSASGNGIYVLPVIVLIVAVVKYLF